jgi:hypothetical protein
MDKTNANELHPALLTRVATAAQIAEAQLKAAHAIVEEIGMKGDARAQLTVALLSAISTNFAALQTRP